MATYVVGTNMSGYLPDGEPMVATSRAHALAMLKEEMINTIDHVTEDEDRYNQDWINRMTEEASRLLAKRGRASIYIEGYEHWVEKQ